MNSLHHDPVQQSASTPLTEKAGSCPQFPARLAAGGPLHLSPLSHLGPPPWSLSSSKGEWDRKH